MSDCDVGPKLKIWQVHQTIAERSVELGRMLNAQAGTMTVSAQFHYSLQLMLVLKRGKLCPLIRLIQL